MIKITLFGEANSGKTNALRCLTYLLNPSYLFPRKKDFEVLVNYQTSGRQKRIVICTGGDEPMDVRNNWDFYQKYCDEKFVDVFISPCHPNDKTREMEEFCIHLHCAPRSSSKHQQMMDFIFWIHNTTLANIVQTQNISPQEIQAFDNAHVFVAKQGTRLTDNQKKEAIAIAKAIKQQIDKLI